MSGTAKGVQNFVKVATAAVTQPAKLAVLGIGLGIGVFLPQVAVPIILLSFATVAGMSWSDINDETFMKSVLSGNGGNSTSNPVMQSLSDITYVIKTKMLFPEVKEDLDRALVVLGRIRSLLGNIRPEDQGYLTFSEEYIAKLTKRLIGLSELEQRAREFLTQENIERLKLETQRVQEQITAADDAVAKKEYEKTLVLLKDQTELQQSLRKRLQRIESYILRINTTFENTYAQMNKILLKDEASFVDEGEILNESLKKMVSDIDEFEKQTIEIASTLDGEKTPQKQKVTT